jgi:anaerobic magnesium-protoporphyrin IX monomethyl ester cyclase
MQSFCLVKLPCGLPSDKRLFNSACFLEQIMKCLFVYKTASLDITDPMGIMCLIANVKKHGHQSDLFLTNLEKDLFKSVREYQPDVIGFSVTSGSENYYLELIRRLRKHVKFVSIMGGPHPTFFPEIIEKEEVDIICRGEGDEALVELLDRMQEGKDYSDIRNLWVKKDGQIIKNPMRPLIQDLDSLPFPDRASFLKYYAYAHSSVKHFLSSRGCPYDCAYCFNHMLKKLYRDEAGPGQYCRLRSVENVIREVEEVKNNYPLKIVYFHDDLFIMNKTWLKEFSAEYKKRVGLPMICYVRANLVNEEVVQCLKEANCITIAMGVESGNENIRKTVLKRNMTNDQIVNAARLFHKYGISIMTQNMVGLPEETIENAYETIQVNTEVKPAYAWVSIFQPYPRTELHRFCIEKGYLDPSHQQHASYQVESPINKGVTKREFENLHKFFALSIEFPWVRKLSRRLIRWPNNIVFNVIYRFFKGYTHIVRLKMSSGEIGFLGYLWDLLGYKIRRHLGKTY